MGKIYFLDFPQDTKVKKIVKKYFQLFLPALYMAASETWCPRHNQQQDFPPIQGVYISSASYGWGIINCPFDMSGFVLILAVVTYESGVQRPETKTTGRLFQNRFTGLNYF